MDQQPLVNQELTMERFPGKGGWTYIRMPHIPQDKRSYFGAKKIHGFIDSYELKDGTLMPMGKGVLFLPVKADIRKRIGKQEGDMVKVVLYAAADEPQEVIPEDFLECLKDEPAAWKAFQQLPEKEQQDCIRWLMEVNVLDARIQRMATAINNLAAGLPAHPTKKN
ncbi:YdeI/OmpD-associated family protein [Chitinophaga solisilvae]|uniref:YdeI/OmpD-associated family protein n=1 Tax=Chitinophaga solisilvae TaxID=1233460 RepID=UPI00136CE5ED|nr:YdeI/OmpD-associated family protein [Chitinophaga solisilvae]